MKGFVLVISAILTLGYSVAQYQQYPLICMDSNDCVTMVNGVSKEIKNGGNEESISDYVMNVSCYYLISTT